MQYKLGKQYKMKVVGDICKDSNGYDYIAIQDDEREYRVYNILKCQYDSLPEMLYVKVKGLDINENYKFKQDEERLIREHYQTGKLYPFEVIDIKQDHNSDTPYYVIEDDFMTHRYYYRGEQKYQIDEHCILEVKGFTDKGYLDLKEVEHQAESKIVIGQTTNYDKVAPQQFALWKDLPVLAGVAESETLELKTSIVFPPNSNSEPDIDKQLYNILKELVAFMNTKGGVLYIGVHDETKKVVGIEQDYPHLNDGEDEYAGSYKKNTDGYELKIRNTMDRLCPSVANSLTTIEFPELEGHTYCKISVIQAKRPVFLRGNQLWVRQGNRLKALKGDEITFFVQKRVTVSIKDVLDTEDLAVNVSGIDIEMQTRILQKLLNERNSIPTDLPEPKPLGEIDYWITWYNDGTWKKTRNQTNDSDVYKQVPVYKNLSNPDIVFCYESGRVNKMKLKVFREGAKMNKIQNNGWSKTEKPMYIFIMHPTDFLVGYCLDSNGIEYVKLHSISDYRATSTAKNQGSSFIPEGCKVKLIAPLGAEHKKHVERLIVTQARRSSDRGTPLSSPSLKAEIEYLEKALKQVNP